MGHFSPGIAIQIFEDAQDQVNRSEKKQYSFSELASGTKSARNHSCSWIFQQESRAKICKCMHGNPQKHRKVTYHDVSMIVCFYLFLGLLSFFFGHHSPFTKFSHFKYLIFQSSSHDIPQQKSARNQRLFSHLKLLSGNCPKLSFGGLRGISGTKGLRGRDNLPKRCAAALEKSG